MVEWALTHHWMTFIVIYLLIVSLNNIFCAFLGYDGDLSFIHIVK